MSRHSLQPLPGRGTIYEVAIGWDRALATYFVIVFGVPDDRYDEHGGAATDELVPLFWQGTNRCALASPEAAIDLAAAYATIPEGLAAQLRADRESKSATVTDPVRSRFLAKFWPKAKGGPRH